MPQVVEVQNLSFRYGSVQLLKNIAFSVQKGEFIAVIGSNGAGKSTLLKLLLGELAPDGGSVALFGTETNHFREWRRLGYVPQHSPAADSAFPATVEEVVCANLYSEIGLFRFANKRHREKARQALEQVGMRGFARRLLHELSGGQLQRVMIARALVADCELLLMDEPAAGVDEESAEALYKLLEKLREGGTAIVMVTHDTSRASAYVDRALCLEEGSLVELNREQLEHEMSHRHKHPR